MLLLSDQQPLIEQTTQISSKQPNTSRLKTALLGEQLLTWKKKHGRSSSEEIILWWENNICVRCIIREKNWVYDKDTSSSCVKQPEHVHAHRRRAEKSTPLITFLGHYLRMRSLKKKQNYWKTNQRKQTNKRICLFYYLLIILLCRSLTLRQDHILNIKFLFNVLKHLQWWSYIEKLKFLSDLRAYTTTADPLHLISVKVVLFLNIYKSLGLWYNSLFIFNDTERYCI